MNPYVVIVAMTLIVMMVMFGHNPMEEVEKKKEKYGGDKLIQAIHEHNENPGLAPKPEDPGVKPPPAPVATLRQRNARVPYSYPPYMLNNQQPYNNNNNNNTGFQNPQNNYYPPIQEKLKPQSLLKRPYFYLATGQPIAFFGSEVYTLNNKGIAMPLPDGIYPLFNGSYYMFVRDGKKVSMQN